MFWTAVIWGLGVSCGAAFGLMLFVVMFSGWKCLIGYKDVQHAIEMHKESIAALVHRNAIGEQSNEILERIAWSTERQESAG